MFRGQGFRVLGFRLCYLGGGVSEAAQALEHLHRDVAPREGFLVGVDAQVVGNVHAAPQACSPY